VLLLALALVTVAHIAHTNSLCRTACTDEHADSPPSRATVEREALVRERQTGAAAAPSLTPS
jgi:hypothetical protein